MKFAYSIFNIFLSLKIALNVLFFLKKQSLTRPSHSMKLMGGGGYLGSILTTLLSTFGGGLKLLRPTFIKWSTLAKSWTFTLSLQYIFEPGLAMRRWANSRWNMRTAQRNIGLCYKSLKTKGEEIWYGVLAIHMSKNGISVLMASPWISPNLWLYPSLLTRLLTSAIILGSISIAIIFFPRSSN